MAGFFGHTTSGIVREASGCNFLHLTIILGIVVEEFVLCHHLSSGEHHALILRFIAADRNLGTLKIAFYHHLAAFHESHAQGGCQLVSILHLRHAEAAAIGSGFYEARHAHLLGYLFFSIFIFFATTQQDALSHVHAHTAKIIVQYIFVKGHCLNQHATGAVRNVEQFKVALYNSVLAWSAMNGNVGIVEGHFMTI